MKKFFLLMSLILTMMPLMAAPGESLLNPKTFDWVNGNEQEAGETVYYEVDLSGVPEGNNVLLYMSNLTDENATVTTQAYLRNGSELTEGPTTKVLSPRRNAAMEFPRSMFNLLGERKIVYIKLTADQKIKFSAEPVEPGEKDVDCLSAKDFVWNGTTHNAGKTWYKVDLASVMGNPAKTVEVTIKNQGTAAATVHGGISTDCPSTGTMDRTFTLGAGAENVYTLKRSQLSMLGADLLYIRLESDQKLLLQAREVDALAANEVKAEDPIDFDLNTTYTLGNNATQWYKVNVADLAALAQALEVFVENTSSATTTIDAHLQYAVISSDYMTRSITLSAGDKVSKEIARNLINTVHASTETAYLRLKTTKSIAFSARTKGSACLDAEAFAIGTSKAHAASADAKWYAIDITAAKADSDNDLKVTITNNGGAAATVAAEVAFECPCADATPLTRTIAAGASLSKVLNNSMYSSLATNTIWVSVKSNQNLTISAEPVKADPFTPIDACESATAFALGTSYDVTAESWFAVTLSDVLADPTKLPEVKVENTGAATATVTVEVAFACPVMSAMQSRTIKIAAGSEYVKEMTADMLKSLDPAITTAYVRVTTDQPITFEANLKLEPCEAALPFDWNGTTHAAGAEWYKLSLASVAPTNLVEVTVENLGAGKATVFGSLSLDCPSTGTMDRTITVNAGAQNVYTINRSQLNMLGASEIYIRVESDQELLISAEEVTAPTTDITVENAIDFELETPYTVAANGSQWYKIDMNDVDQARQLLEVTIENMSATATTINAVLQYKLTATAEEYMTRSLSLGGNQVYVKEIARNLIETVHGNTEVAYVRLETTEEITFSVRLKRFSEGTGCLKAKDFDKAGTYQAGSEEITWYAIDITAEKADAANDLEIIVENRSAAPATVTAQIAFECPCDVTTDLTRTLAAGATVSKKLLYSTYANLATDTIWVGVKSDKNIMMSARPVPADYFEPITACDGAEHFKLDTLYTQDATEKWYVGLLSEMLAEENKVPEFTITNNGTATATVKVEVAFACPVTSAMQSRTITIAAGATYTKKPTIDMLNSIDPDIDSVFVRITSSQPVSAIATLKYENEGLSCATATEFDWVNGNDHAANDTVWYVVDLTEAQADGKGVVITVKNLENATASIRADLSMECPNNTGLTTYNTSLGAYASKSKTIAPSMVASVSDGRIYICIASNKALHLSADTITIAAEDEEGCLKAQEFKWNHTYTQTETDTVWYKVSLKNLRDGHNVPHLYLNNIDTKAIRVTGELTFDCAQATSSKTFAFAAGQEWDKLLEQDLIDGIDLTIDTAYVKLYGTGTFEFRVENQDPNQGQDCLHAIPFNWVDGNIHLEGDSLWYVIELADTLAVETRDLRINVKNLNTTKEVNAQFTIVTDCKRAEEDVLVDNETATLAAGATTSRTITNDILKGYGAIRIGLKTDADVHITAEFVTVERKEFTATRDTIFGGVCAGDLAGFTYAVADSTLNRYISEDRTTWTWTDTITFNYSEIELADSIVTFNIIPIQQPSVFYTDPTSWPTFVEGQAFDIDAISAELIAKYAAARNAVPEPYRDTIAVVDTIGWQMRNIVTGRWGEVLTTRIPFGVEELIFHYFFGTQCDESRYSTEIFVNVLPGVKETQTAVADTLCAGDPFKLLSGDQETITVNADMSFVDTVLVSEADYDKLLLYPYELKVWKSLNLPTGLDAYIHAQAGLPLDITEANTKLVENLTAQTTADAQVVRFTNVTWEMLNAENTFAAIPTTPLEDVATITLRYGVETTCETVYDTLEISLTSVAEHYTTVADTLCVGEPFNSRLQTITVTADITFNDTVRAVAANNQVVDSIYTYDLKVWKELTLPTGLDAYIHAQAGLPLDITAADAALLADLTAQTADELVVRFADVTWEIKNADDTFGAIPTTPIADDVTTITLRYGVETTCETLYSTFEVTVVPVVEAFEAVDTILCAGETFNSRLQSVEVTADVIFSDTVRVITPENTVVDSIYTYDIKVWRDLVLPNVASDINPQVGVVLDITAADAALRADLDAQITAEPLTVAYTDIVWAWLNPETNAFEALPTAHLGQMETITLHYTVTTTCGEVVSEDMVITLHDKLQENVIISDTVCAGFEYPTREGLVTIVGDTVFAQTIEFVKSETQLGDSIYHYDIKVFVPVTLPAALTVLPQAICGQPLHIDEATLALQEVLTASLEEINSEVTTITWEVFVEGEWVDATTLATIPSLPNEDLSVRYVVTTSCGDVLTSDVIILTVEGPTADNTDSYANMPAVSKYNGWLLMINLNGINDLGFFPTEEQVAWYKIVGAADFEAVAGDQSDELVGTGYYFTTGEQLTGAYYAVIEMAPVTEDPCGAVLRTVTITCASSPTPISIAPSMVTPGEDVVISGLNPAETYSLDIFNLMGILVETREVTGVATYTIKAQDITGYYMLNVKTAAEATTLRYIVK